MSGIVANSFRAAPSDGALNFTWDICGSLITPSNVKSIYLHLTDSARAGTTASAISVTKIVPAVVNGAVVLQYTMSGLSNNTTYLALLEINTTTHSYTQSTSALPGTVPAKPEFTVTSASGKLTINFTNYQHGSVSEGFYRIKTLKIYHANGTELAVFSVPLNHLGLTAAESTALYVAGNDITGLTDNTVYELSATAENDVGVSQMSSTVLATPGNGVQGINSRVVVSTLEYNRVANIAGDAKTATVLFGNAPNQAQLLAAGYPIQRYNIYREDVSSNGTTVIANSKALAGFISLDASGLTLTPDVSYNYSSTLGSVSTVPFRFIDSAVATGRFYQYSVRGVNSIGEGISTIIGIAKIGSMASAPTISAVPSNTSIRVFVTNNALNGYDLLASGYDIDVCGNVTSNITLDASGAYTVPGLTNGLSYVIKVRSATANTDTPFIYKGFYSSTVTSMPFTAPTAPVLAATPLDSTGAPIGNAIDLSWNVPARNGNTGAISYDVYLNNALLASALSSTTYRVSSLVNGIDYSFTVVAKVQNTEVNASQSSLQSNVVVARSFVLPTAATSVALSISSATALTGSWAAPANASTYGLDASNIKYKYELQVASSGVIVSSASNSTVLSASFTSLTAGTLYKLIVTPGYVYNGTTYYNDAAVVSVLRAPFTAPSAPQNIVVQPLDGKIRLTWDAPTNLNGVTPTLYRIFVTPFSQDYGNPVTTIGYENEYAIVDKFQNNGNVLTAITNGTTYKVKIDVFGTVPQTLSSTFTTDGADSTDINVTPDVSPAAPVVTSVVGGDTIVNVTWTRNPLVTGYIVYMGDNPIRKQAVSAGSTNDFTVTATTVTFKFGGNSTALPGISGSVSNGALSNGSSYNVKIVAYQTNSSSTDLTSPSTDLTIYPIAAPSQPRNFIATVDGNGTAVFSWDAPSSTNGAGVGSNGPLLYRIIVDASNSDSSANVITQDSLTTTSYTTTGLLIDNNQYRATLYAYFLANGQEYPSPPATLLNVTTNPAPQNVTGLTAVAGDHRVTLSWVNPTGNDNVLYPKVRIAIYKSTNGGAYALYKTDASNATQFIDVSGASIEGRTATNADLFNGYTYTYKVVCEHAGPTVEGAQQPTGAIVSAIPFGKPLITACAFDNFTGSQQITINKNGRDLQEYLLVGVDPSGLDIPVYNGVIPANAVYTGSASTSSYIAGNSTYVLSVQTGFNFNSAGSALLTSVQNAAGITTRVFPSGSTLFTSNP